MRDDSPLSFFISERNSIIIVSFVGSLSSPKSAHTLAECLEDLAIRRSAKWVILNFRDVSHLGHRSVFEPLLLLQKNVKSRAQLLRIASLHPILKETLLKNKVIQMDDLCNNLTEAFESLNLRRAA